ncbi:hypothetical protein KY335_02105 [Candidatus Woesearchaeota archaeon]|nr:hypothetical protein [Candidatus Woesearchaeota archaeon]MBW3014010.1 hypothetical protein [Candidatus Woesearchaeota archaeon]
MRFEFGGKSKLNGRLMHMYPARISYVPVSKDGLEEYIFAYEAQLLKLANLGEDPIRPGDFLTPAVTLTPLAWGHIYPIVGSEKNAFVETNGGGRSITVHATDSAEVTLPLEKLAFAIPGPETEPRLYEDAEIEVNPKGEVTLFYRELGVKVILETIEADDRFRAENSELVAQNELFVINDM